MLGPQDIQLGVNESMKDTGTIFLTIIVCMYACIYICMYLYVCTPTIMYLCQQDLSIYVCMYVCLMAEPYF